MLKKIKQYISKEFIFPKVEIKNSDNLSDTVVLVTGASRGIGMATVETIFKNGGNVVAVSRNINKLREAFPEEHPNILLLSADITDEVDVKKVIETTLIKFGKIDVLINNTGVNTDKPLEEASIADFENITDTNIRSIFLMCKHVVPIMKKGMDGFIVNIGSKISHNTNISPNKVLYATTKYALEGFSYALNKELKPFGIRVSCLMPGTVNTFVSLHAKEYLSSYHVAEVISTMIRLSDIDFESVVIKSKYQNI